MSKGTKETKQGEGANPTSEICALLQLCQHNFLASLVGFCNHSNARLNDVEAISNISAFPAKKNQKERNKNKNHQNQGIAKKKRKKKKKKQKSKKGTANSPLLDGHLVVFKNNDLQRVSYLVALVLLQILEQINLL